MRVTSEDITSTADDVTVDIGLRVGLRDINISLTGQLLRFTRYILIIFKELDVGCKSVICIFIVFSAPVDNVDYNEGFSLRQGSF